MKNKKISKILSIIVYIISSFTILIGIATIIYYICSLIFPLKPGSGIMLELANGLNLYTSIYIFIIDLILSVIALKLDKNKLSKAAFIVTILTIVLGQILHILALF